jgi:mannose-6-phosphate isomerase
MITDGPRPSATRRAALTADHRATDDRRVTHNPQALTPARFGRPWGGGRFGTVGEEPVGEIWVSGDDATLPDGRTLAASGLAATVPLVKVLDVAAQLSVQVHPDDLLAHELHGEVGVGKHEAWVVLEATSDAMLAVGLSDPVRVDDLFSGDEARVVASLAIRRPTTGQIIDVAPGTVHAPAAGVLLYEVQQRSDLTYRIFDWGRTRPLHVTQARLAIRPEASVVVRESPSGSGIFDLIPPPAPFRLRAVRPGPAVSIELDRNAVLSVIEGDVVADGSTLDKGSHWLLSPGSVAIRGSGAALLAEWR